MTNNLLDDLVEDDSISALNIDDPSNISKPQKMTRFEYELAILLFAFFVMCVGSEISFAQFIYTYTQQELSPLLNSTKTNSFVEFLNQKENPVRDMGQSLKYFFQDQNFR